MADNSIDYASIFQTALDKTMIPEMTSRAMEAQASQVKYTGGDEFKILTMALTGLGDYSRSSGFPATGAVTTSWKSYGFDKDRGQEFVIDAMDDDEGFLDIAGSVMGEFQRTKVAPEVDAYRFSKVWSYALADGKVGRYSVDKTTVYSQLTSDIATMQDVIGENEPLTIYASFAACEAIDKSTEMDHQISMEDVGGKINDKVRVINNIPIIKVPSIRFKTEYTFSATDGFSADATASAINWIICADRAVIAIVKTEKVRTFSPDVNQDADAWKLQYRKYHTLIVPTNKTDGIYVNYAGATAPALTATVAVGSAAGTKFTATASEGTTLGYILGAASPAVKYLDLIDSFDGSVEPYTSAADIATATAGQYLTMCEVNSDGRIVKVLEAVLASGDIKA